MLDYQTIYEVGMARRDDMLRQAAVDMLASELPSAPSVVRGTISRWLYAMAEWLEPRGSSVTLRTGGVRVQAG